MRVSIKMLVGIVLLVAVVGLSGCTLLGYWVGSEIDESYEAQLILPPDSALTLLETGDEVVCRFKDGESRAGIYAGMSMPYREQLVERLREEPLTPCVGGKAVTLGEGIVLHRRDRSPEHVRFLAADARRIWYIPQEGDEPRILLFEHVTRLTRCTGEALDPPFEVLVNAGRFDSPRFLRLLQSDAVLTLDTAQIRDMTFQFRPVTGRIALGVLGAVTDGVLLAMATREEEEKRPPPPVKKDDNKGTGTQYTGVTGCPLAESWDGAFWQREVECVPGAFFRASQRTDVARLRHMRPDDGLLRLRVRDILEEVDSIDRLGLLCVEHVPGSVVYATEEGHVLAVRPSVPLSAADDRDRNVLPLLRAEDEEHWLALPSADPVRRGERRSVECRFPLSAEADSVTLLLRLRNTLWGSELHRRFLSLYGSELQAQYDLLNASAEARACFRALMEREGLLAVSVWDGRQWLRTGTIREVGHEAWRDVARRIDVRGITTGELRIRLDVPAAVWMVDHVAVDAAPPSPVRVTALSLVSAERSDGRRCTSQLRDVDGAYVSLDTGEWVEAAFRVPMPPTDGHLQDFLIECNGYYRPKLAPASVPQTALIGRILDEPGFFARYAEGLFWDGLTALDDGVQR